MPIIAYQASNFPPNYDPRLAGRHSLDVTWAELIWAAISVGRGELLHLFRHGPFSAFEIVYRAAVLYANLRQTPGNHLTRSSAYDGLDPSEKSAISYFLGMTLAKLFADKLLNVPWLMHLDVYRADLDPALMLGRSRPDLVGQNSVGDWIAIESKGRTNEYEETAMLRAKEQVQNLATIGGVPPTLRVALLAHFDDGILECAIDDPKKKNTKERETVELPLTKQKLIQGYYRPFREWLRESPDTRSEQVQNRRYRVSDLREVDVSVGLREDLLTEEGEARSSPHRTAEREYEGPDGLLIRVGELWSEANMKRQPQERRTDSPQG